MDRLRTILVVTDLSARSSAALVEAMRLSELSGATLHAMYVIRKEHAGDLREIMPASGSGIGPDLVAHLRAQAREEMAPETHPIIDKIKFVEGNPIQEILRAIETLGADLLVLGVRGAGKSSGIGTTAVRCVRKAPTKVLLVPEDASGPFEEVMACIDFSSMSRGVMAQAERVTKLEGGKVTAVYMYEMPWDSSTWVKPADDPLKLEQEYHALMERKFRSELCEDPDIEFELVKSHDYAKGIVTHAAKAGADLVITGTTGRSGLGYMLLGTTAERVIREVGCAVLAVKDPAKGIKPGSGGREENPSA